jgi:hypothetical protein
LALDTSPAAMAAPIRPGVISRPDSRPNKDSTITMKEKPAKSNS